jgi:hypothetical protein
MTTVTLWILIFTGSGYRPAAVVDRFSTEAACNAAAAQMDRLSEGPGIAKQFPACLRAEVAR